MLVDTSDGVRLAVHDLGGSDRALLWCHATGFHGRVWRALARRLSDRHSWALDFRGHGQSTPPVSGHFGWDGFADDVLATVDALAAAGVDVDGISGAGHSKGGAALLLAEARRPGTFGALWLYEPVVFPPDGARPAGDNPLAAGARARRRWFPSLEAAEANFAGKPPMDAFDPEVRADYVRFGFRPAGATEVGPDDGARDAGREGSGSGVVLCCAPEHEARVYEAGSRHGAWDVLGDVRCPVTVVRGRIGEAGPAHVAEAVAGRLPAGRLEVHDELGHFGPLEDPVTMAASVEAALGEAGRSAA
ncbi:MAG: alpha/beta hydrolase [Actinobacteria bacterium]|nr:alpha/beta hydrolase [Actinomycetota bacterium]